MIRLSRMLKFANFINLKISLNSFNPEYLELKDNKSHIKMKLNYIIAKELSLRLLNIMHLFEINNNFLSKDKDYISSTIFNFWQNTQSDKLLIDKFADKLLEIKNITNDEEKLNNQKNIYTKSIINNIISDFFNHLLDYTSNVVENLNVDTDQLTITKNIFDNISTHYDAKIA